MSNNAMDKSNTVDEKNRMGSYSWANERPSNTPKITASDIAVFAALLLLQSLISYTLFVIYRGYAGWGLTKSVDKAWIVLGGVQSGISIVLIGCFIRLVFARWRNRLE
ncbi:hypothetical protein ACHAQA_007234 [Verticillium albo-atrum]